MFLQQRNGQFEAASLPYCAGEITANTFFDADGDGDSDLYLGTGGYESSQQDTAQLDYLLLNDGKGHFSIAGPDRLPAMYEQTSCAAACDFDGDGDSDLFVGSRAIAGMYGMIPQSFLLENDGKGHFHDVALGRGRELTRAGMITAAAWADMDKDGHFDLVLGGEWMNLTVFYQRNNSFEKFEIPNSSGLWQSMALADLDQDGDPDLVAGNLGLNSNLRASVQEPLGLWVKDFDRNGAYDPILSYYRQGKNYVFADKDLLLSQLPFLKKRFVEYRKYAESTFEEVFDKDMRADALHWQAVDLNSGWFEIKAAAPGQVTLCHLRHKMSPGMAVLTDDFNGDGKQDILLAGNFYEVQPAIGRFDAGFGLLLQQK